MVGQSDVGVNDGVVEIFDVGYGRAVRLCPSNHKHHVGDFGCGVVYFDLGFGNGFCRLRQNSGGKPVRRILLGRFCRQGEIYLP